MANDLTTEDLYAGLSPEARTEAVRLATRLQAAGGESAHVVAAAREAGIEDRYLREAVAHLGSTPPVVRVVPPTLAAGVALLFLFAQGYASSVTFGGVSGANLWVPLFLAAALGVVLPRERGRWLGPLAVAATWLVLSAFSFGMRALAGWNVVEMGFTFALRIAAVEAALAFVGTVVAGTFAGRGSKDA